MAYRDSPRGGYAGDPASDLTSASWLPPRASAGWEVILNVLYSDRCLPAATKALYMAAASAAQGDRITTAGHLTRAKRLGASKAEIAGVVSGVLASRGQSPFSIMSAAVSNLELPDSRNPPGSIELSPGAARAYFEDYFGFVPSYIELLEEHSPEALDGYFMIRESCIQSNPLGPLLAELLFCAINATDYSVQYLEVHSAGALRAGATVGQLVEAMLCAVPSSGVPAWIAGGTAITNVLRNENHES